VRGLYVAGTSRELLDSDNEEPQEEMEDSSYEVLADLVTMPGRSSLEVNGVAACDYESVTSVDHDGVVVYVANNGHGQDEEMC
jgi:hypothetical protein